MSSDEGPGRHRGRPVSDLAASLIRTYVPMWVAAGLTLLAARWGVGIDADTSAYIVALAVGAAFSAYYGLARFMERQRGTGRGAGLARAVGRWMLGGWLPQPVYVQPGKTVKVDRADP